MNQKWSTCSLRGGRRDFINLVAHRVLEIVNVGNASARLDDDEKDDIRSTDAIGRQQITIIINEPGLYRLVMRSDKPQAKPFQKWVTGTVLLATCKDDMDAG